MPVGVSEFSKHSGLYWKSFLKKIRSEIPLVTSPGEYVTLDKNAFVEVRNVSDLDKFKKGNSNSYVLPLKGGGTVLLGKIAKANVNDGGSGRKKYNLGNVAEGVIAFAMAARFLSKNKVVTTADVRAVLEKMKKKRNGTSSKCTFPSPNAPHPKMRKPIFDDVEVTVNLANPNMDMLYSNDEDEKDILTTLMKPCIAYANGNEISTAAKIMYENGVKDYIEIIADGIGDETGTKVDVRLQINGKLNVEFDGDIRGDSKLELTQISLKKDVNQFAQVGGWTLDKMQNFWGRILGENIANISAVQTIYEKDTAIKGETADNVAAVMRDMYTWGNKELQKKFKNKVWLEHFVDTLDDMATYREENVQLIEIKEKTGEYERYNFKKLKVALLGRPDLDIPANLVLSSTYITGASGLPTVRIQAKNLNNGNTTDILQFRHKIEKGSGTKPKAIRNYVEKQKGLAEYVG